MTATTTTAPTTTTRISPIAGWAAAAGAIASAVAGAIQAVRSDDGNPLVDTSEHVLLAMVAAALVLWIPGYLALGRLAGTRTARIGGYLAVAGAGLLALGMTSTNLHDQDYSWFPIVAAPANLFWLAGSIMLAVATWRTRTLPRPLAAALVLVWLTSIILSQAGGNLIAGVIWGFVAWSLLAAARHTP
ncbi:hypothetical protein AB0F81_35690 [Actinoplanes sp. NPDC024001]|uniref:hypothetical protein n=1 Tax=Actinoplanes sp. NPDC024001 TaxID=3154598 RepID=UPI0033C78D07